MRTNQLTLNWKKWTLASAALILVGGGAAYAARLVTQIVIMNRMLRVEFTDAQQTLRYQQIYFENQIAGAQQNFQDQKSRNDAIEQQVSQITNTVGTLTTLSNTDPQLLQKYSRVYFLNENYVPASLTNLDPAYLFDASRAQQFLTPAVPFLTNLLIAASQVGIPLKVASAYRSFDTQGNLNAGYAVTYGTGANTFSAEQGYSEHQLGTAVDFITPDFNALTLKFASSSAYAWLTANAYRYGFVLSYPKNNPYYIYEPWHWRFVGIALATWLHDTNTTFYDAPQRTINQYLVSLFDQ